MWSICTFGQNAQIDSLKNELRLTTDTTRVNLLEELSFKLWDYDVAEAYRYSLEGLRLSESLNYTKGMAWSNTHIGLYYYFIGQFDQALLFYRKSIELLGDKVYDNYPSYTWSRIANLYRIQSKFDSAINYYRIALTNGPEEKMSSTSASIYFNLGICYLEMEEFDSAKYYLNYSLRLRENMNDSLFMNSSLKELGHLFLKSGDLDSAEYYLKLSKQLGDRLDLPEMKIFYAIYNGELELLRGNYFEAIESIKSSLKLLNDYDFRQLRVKSLFLLGIIYSEIGEYDGAIENLLKAETMNAPLSNRKQEAEINFELGYVYYSQKYLDIAKDKSIKAKRLFETLKLERLEAATNNLLGNIEFALNNYEASMNYFDQGMATYEKLNYSKGIATISYNKSYLYLAQNDTIKALEIQLKSLQIEESLNNVIGMIISYNSLGSLYISLKKFKEAEKYLTKAKELLDKHPTYSNLEENNRFFSELYYAKNNYKKAYDYLKLSRENADSLFSQNSLSKTLQLSAIHDLEKKEIEIQTLNQERIRKNIELQLQESQLRQQKIILYLGGIALIFFSILSYALIKTIRKLGTTQQELVKAEKRASLGILIAGLGHEINNPLNFIKGGIESLRLSQDNWNDDQLKMIMAVEEGVTRSTKILNTLNRFQSQQKSVFATCDLTKIIELVITDSDMSISPNIEVSLKDPTREAIIYGNRILLQRLFKELIKNSMQSIPKYGKVEIEIIVKKPECIIYIRDNGIGINQQNISSIENPFFTTKDPDKGKGLGLYIVDYILFDHNGQITFESEKGKGTTAIITLPKNLK